MNWHIGWGLTHKCNLQCRHCYNSSGMFKQKEIAFDEAKKIVDKLFNNGIKTINYGTGEADLLSYFWDLVQYVSSKKILQGLTTNGYSVNDDTINDITKYMNDVDVSIDYPDEERHNEFRGHKCAWKWAIGALELLKKNNISFSIVTCLHAENCDYRIIDEFTNLCKKYDCEWRINWFKPTGRGKFDEKLKLQVNVVYDIFKYIIQRCDIVALPDPLFSALIGMKQKKGCPCGKTSFRITPEGNIVPCVYLTKSLAASSFNDVEIKDIHNSPLFFEINNRKLDECIDCEYLEYCQGGCATRAFLEHNTMNSSDSFCYKKANFKTNPLKDLKYNVISKKMKVHEEYLCTMIVKPKKIK